MQEIHNSNPAVVTAIYHPNKYQARHHRNISCILSNHNRGIMIRITSKTGVLSDQKHATHKYVE